MRLLYPSPYRELAAVGRVPVRRIRYGQAPSQWADLRVPPRATLGVRCPVVVLLHGGFWRRPWRADLMNALALDLAARGMASWNLEYRRTGMRGGGFPGTLEDAVAGVDALAGADAAVDAARAVLVGHSAGGHLALVAARRARVRPAGVVVLAGISDLRAAARGRLGDGAAQALMGGEPGATAADAYATASPLETLPLGVPTLLVHGVSDQAVPVSMSTLYAARARSAGDDVELAVLRDTGHAELIDPRTPSWSDNVVPWMLARLANGPEVR